LKFVLKNKRLIVNNAFIPKEVSRAHVEGHGIPLFQSEHKKGAKFTGSLNRETPHLMLYY